MGGATHRISVLLTKVAGDVTEEPKVQSRLSGRKLEPAMVITSPPTDLTDDGVTSVTIGDTKMSIAVALPTKSTPFSLRSTATKPALLGSTTAVAEVRELDTPFTTTWPKRTNIGYASGLCFSVCEIDTGYPPTDPPITGTMLVMLKLSMKLKSTGSEVYEPSASVTEKVVFPVA
jgi:hypothetical protein